ncbi:hypothetical protein HK101_010127, partial [Irineochytrium annulatum]
MSAPSSTVMPPRPAQGTVGKSLKVVANVYRITDYPKKVAHLHEFKCVPWGSHRSRLRVLHEISVTHRGAGTDLGDEFLPVFDGNHILYTARPLPKPEITLRVTLPDEGGGSGSSGSGGSVSGSSASAARRRSGNEFTVTIIKRAEVDMGRLAPFLRGKRVTTPADAIHLLNLVVGQKGSEMYTQ